MSKCSYERCGKKSEGFTDRCYMHNQHRMNRENQYKNEYFDLFNKLFNPTEEKPRQQRLQQQRYQTNQYDLFVRLHISTKEEWKHWIIKNHPDKGGDTTLFIQVLKVGRTVFTKSN
jgi:hypothetical protein